MSFVECSLRCTVLSGCSHEDYHRVCVAVYGDPSFGEHVFCNLTVHLKRRERNVVLQFIAGEGV
jgi:hypothetical protein